MAENQSSQEPSFSSAGNDAFQKNIRSAIDACLPGVQSHVDLQPGGNLVAKHCLSGHPIGQKQDAGDFKDGMRSHVCSGLSEDTLEKTVSLAGWVHKKRDHGGLLFVDLRDHTGLVQCVLDQNAADPAAFQTLNAASLESVVQVTGTLVRRSAQTVNADLMTGFAEVVVGKAHVLSAAEPLPLQVNSDEDFPEETRLKYRFLDVRRARMQQNLLLRSAVIKTVRELMQNQGFLEVQTPILTASSPEGARDFLVPSRLHPGRCYALPQAPQQFKQLLMAGGVNRYFQIAPCFRDEDARKDRSPGEFYQLDLEMAFATQEDVFRVTEYVLFQLFQKFAAGRQVSDAPFPRISYAEAMLRYGSDKPDLRNPLVIEEISALFTRSPFDLFRRAVSDGKVVRAVRAPGILARSRKFFDDLTHWAQQQGAKGLAYVLYDGTALKGPLSKFFVGADLDHLIKTMGITAGDGVFFVCDVANAAAAMAGLLRTQLAETLDLLEKNAFRFCWVVDFPMYEKNPETDQIEFSHNPFSMPQGGMQALKTQDPLTIKAWQYDCVVNGIELSSGAIRNHLPDVMIQAFQIAGYGPEEVEARFGALLRAFRYGVPPHGGVAPGLDRIVMLLADEDNLREVTAFPLNQRAQDPLMGAPSSVSEQQMRALSLRFLTPKT